MFTEIMLIGVDVDDFLSKVWRPKQSPLPSWLSPVLCALNNVSPDDTLLCAAALNNALNEWLWSYLRMQLSNSPVSAHHRLTSGARGDTTLKGVLKAVSEGGITMQVRDGWPNQNGWIFGKVPNDLWPPPPHFRKIMLRFFSGIHDRRSVYNGKNLQHKFLDWKWK